MTTLANETYEGATNGTQISTSNTTWETVTGGANNTFTNLFAANGSLGCRISEQGTLRKTVTAINGWRVRWYQSVPVIAPGTNVSIGVARATTTIRAAVRYEAAGTLRLVDGGSVVGSSSASLVANQKIRCEWAVNGGAGTQSLEIFRGTNSEGTTPDETLSGAFTNNTVDNIGVMWTTLVTGWIIYYDEVVITDTPGTLIGGFPTGPAGVWTFGREMIVG